MIQEVAGTCRPAPPDRRNHILFKISRVFSVFVEFLYAWQAKRPKSIKVYNIMFLAIFMIVLLLLDNCVTYAIHTFLLLCRIIIFNR